MYTNRLRKQLPRALVTIAPVTLRPFDLAVIIAYLAGITWFGARFRSRQHSLRDYFLGGQAAPWWAIALSIVSAETSTLTIIGTPPLAYAGSYVFLQVVFGYLLARIVISAVFLPQYFKGQMFTAYELMQRRFGSRVRKVTAAIFLVTRSLAEGVRVFAVSIVVSVILHTGSVESILAIIALTLFYTFEGGMTAVIWTDVIQMGMYVFGAAISFFVLLHKIPGGFGHVIDVAVPAGKLRVFDFHWSWTLPYTFWAGVIGGTFLTAASHGTDQLVVQRLLSAKSERQSRLALLSSWGVIFVQFSMFLTIGLLLWVYRNGEKFAADELDRLYPSFIWNSLPTGIAGLAMAAIIAAAMANLSAALNSLASATVVDFYQPFTHSSRKPEHYLKVSRISTVFWGAVLAVIGVVASHWGSVLESGLSIASVTLGILLGVFLLGVLTKRPGENAAIAGVIAGAVTMLVVKFETTIPFTWWVLIGSTVTFGVGYLTSCVA
ncbi:MAG TPA: sodium:solute symporter [Bryobacteraceae bacterium]|nr:sodium:solute symporter [Bryobacteraceae bacterium]